MDNKDNCFENIKQRNQQFFIEHHYRMTSEKLKQRRLFNDAFQSESFVNSNEFLVYLLDSLANFTLADFNLELFQLYLVRLAENSKQMYDFSDRQKCDSFVNFALSIGMDNVLFSLLKFCRFLNSNFTCLLLELIDNITSRHDETNEKVLDSNRFDELLLLAESCGDRNIKTKVVLSVLFAVCVVPWKKPNNYGHHDQGRLL